MNKSAYFLWAIILRAHCRGENEAKLGFPKPLLKPDQCISYLFCIWGKILIIFHLIKRFYCFKNISSETITVMGKKNQGFEIFKT